VCGLCPLSGIIKTREQRFENWICISPQVRREKPTLLGHSERANLRYWTTHAKSVILRTTVSRPSVLVSGIHLGPATNFSFSLKFSLDSFGCYFVAPSLTGRRVCNLLLLLVLASAVPRDSIFYCSNSWDSPTCRARSPYLYPPGTGWPRYATGHWVPFWSPLTSKLKFNSQYDRRPVSQYVLVSSPIWDFRPEIFFFPGSKLRSCLSGAPSLTRGRVCHLLVLVDTVYSSPSVIT
jgi:hypothetical protein